MLVYKNILLIKCDLSKENEVDEMFNKIAEKFDREIFDNLVEKIIIGEKDENNNINPNTIRFILKIGTEYKYEINENKNVSLRPNNVGRFTE